MTICVLDTASWGTQPRRSKQCILVVSVYHYYWWYFKRCRCIYGLFFRTGVPAFWPIFYILFFGPTKFSVLPQKLWQNSAASGGIEVFLVCIGRTVTLSVDVLRNSSTTMIRTRYCMAQWSASIWLCVAYCLQCTAWRCGEVVERILWWYHSGQRCISIWSRVAPWHLLLVTPACWSVFVCSRSS